MARFGIAPSSSGTRRKIATAFAAAGALLLSSGLAVMTAAPASAADQWYVCKYTGKPGTAQTASQIIQVANPSVGQGWFNDEQESYGLWIVGDSQGVPTLADCPVKEGDDTETGDRDIALAVPRVEAIDECGEEGSVAQPSTEGVAYSISGGDWAVVDGQYTITANVVGTGTKLKDLSGTWAVASNGKSATFDVDLGDYEVCEVTATLADLSATIIDDCNEWGSVSRLPDTDYVVYSITGDEWTNIQGSKTVTATLRGGATAFQTPLGDWAPVGDGTQVQQTIQLGSYTQCNNPDGGNPNPPLPTPDLDELVSPRYASATEANCSRDGRLTVPAQPVGVLVKQVGRAPGDVTFTYAAADGYAFPAGTDTEVTVTVPAQLTGDDCIQGVETSKPKPQPGTDTPVDDGPKAAPVKGGTDAEVLGEQAVAVPTAVAAGLGDTMTATTTGSPQLAQALVAGGLLMLVMGGATGLGRRTRGAHES